MKSVRPSNRLNRRLYAVALENRIAPATLQHSLFPVLGPQSGVHFGNAVAADANFDVVGAPLSDVGGITDTGQAFVYNASTGALIATLNNPTPATGDYFGVSVAVSGNTVVVGAEYDDTGSPNAGLAYVFNATTGALIATLNNPTPANNDLFGYSVAVSGNTVVVGAYRDNTGATAAGSAYVFNASTGALITTLNNPSPVFQDSFGISVAISGNTMVVGADHPGVGPTNVGRAYIYDATTDALIATLNNPTPVGGDQFGYSVAVSGNTVVVGANGNDTGATDAGSAYVFNATTGTLVATLNNPTPAIAASFGYSVSVSGNAIVVGAYQDNTGATAAGSAYVFNATTGSLVVTLNNPTPANGDNFGISVAMSGNNVVIGAQLDNTQGAAYIYSLAPSVQTIQVNDGSAQRSEVKSLTVTFKEHVNLPATPANAFQLARIGGAINPVALIVDTSLSTATQTIAKLSFAGPLTEFGSLVDGRYSLTIVSSQVIDDIGQALDGNGDGTPGDDYVLIGSPANGLFRLFGDANGDGTVAASDFIQFRLAFGSSPSVVFDFDGDGTVSASDFVQFRLRFGSSI